MSDYYKASSGLEARSVIEAWQLTFNLGCVVKYICRAGDKGGESRESDLQKALDYVDFEIDFYDRVLNEEQEISLYARAPVPLNILPSKVGESWGLNSQLIDALSLVFEASLAFRENDFEVALERLESLVPILVRVKNG